MTAFVGREGPTEANAEPIGECKVSRINGFMFQPNAIEVVTVDSQTSSGGLGRCSGDALVIMV
jgi:hypothetical protein